MVSITHLEVLLHFAQNLNLRFILGFLGGEGEVASAADQWAASGHSCTAELAFIGWGV